MTLSEWARAVVLGDDLEEKLAPAPPDARDEPGPPERPLEPGRPDRLRFAERAKVPAIDGMAVREQRVRILHGFANHELQAAELYAWALLAFPDAPEEFRADVLRIQADEQRHTRLYLDRLADYGVAFGDYPVSGYFWHKSPDWTTPLRFACAMSLTFEHANLDHTLDFAAAARAAGDEATAAILDRVHKDEITHVRFGAKWLARWRAPGESLWDAYTRSVQWPVRAALAKGKTFHARPRRAAGLEAEFVRRIEEAQR